VCSCERIPAQIPRSIDAGRAVGVHRSGFIGRRSSDGAGVRLTPLIARRSLVPHPTQAFRSPRVPSGGSFQPPSDKASCVPAGKPTVHGGREAERDRRSVPADSQFGAATRCASERCMSTGRADVNAIARGCDRGTSARSVRSAQRGGGPPGSGVGCLSGSRAKSAGIGDSASKSRSTGIRSRCACSQWRPRSRSDP